MKHLLFALLLLLPVQLRAAEPVGIVLLSLGKTEAVGTDGEARALQRRSALFEGDLLRTGPGGRLQVRFSDGGLVAVKPDSEFRVAEYHFDAQDRDQDSAVFELLKGGMRTVTGQIGKQERSDYSVRTVVATIGIRGTHYELQLCDAGCASTRQAPRGLVGRVLDGRIHVSGNAHARDVPSGNYFSLEQRDDARITLSEEPPAGYVADDPGAEAAPASDEPEQSDADPDAETGGGDDSADGTEEATDTTAPVANDAPDSGEGGAEDAGTTTDSTLTGTTSSTGVSAGATLTDPQQSTALDTQVLDSTTTTAAVGAGFTGNAPSGSSVLVAMSGLKSGNVTEGTVGEVTANGISQIELSTVSGVGNVPTRLYHLDNSGGSCQPCRFDSGTGTLSDTGGDGALGLNWGRWIGGFTLTENGVAVDTDHFDYIYSPNITPLSAVTAKTGVLTYNYIGGTRPITENGLVGDTTATTGSITVDFSNSSVSTANLYLSGFSDSRNYSLSLTGSQSLTGVLDGKPLPLDGNCTGGPCSTLLTMKGEMSLEFVGSNADGIISAYGAGAADGTTDVSVSGVGLFK